MPFKYAISLMSLLLLVASTGRSQGISFSRAKDVPLSSPPYRSGSLIDYSFASGDFNGDGQLDIVVSSTSVVNMLSAYSATSKVVLLLGNGDGTFKSLDLSFASKTILLSGIYQQYVLAADVNLDKKLDLIVGFGTEAFLFLGNGDGTFQAAKSLPAFPLVVADFTNDGKPDLLADGQPCSNNGSFHVFPGNGDGTFQNPLPCSPQSGNGDWTTKDIAVGDLNGDGKLDVVWGTVRSTTSVSVWLGNGDGTFQPSITVEALAGQGAKPVALGDLNHDGITDLVVATSHGVSVLLGNGDGTFQDFKDHSLFSGPHYLRWFDAITGIYPRDWINSNDIFMRDFDGDGNLDILVDGIVFRGKGNGTFETARYLVAGSSISSEPAIPVICADFNGDGKPDLLYLPRLAAAQSGAGGSLAIMLNNSPSGLPTNTLGYSAATGGSLLTPSSIASLYGKALAKSTASASSTPLPTQLGGITLRVRDDTDTVRLAQLIFVSPAQINFVVPADTAIGPVTFNIDDGTTPFQEGANATIVTTIAPGFFTVNQTGTGAPAATGVRIRLDGTQEPVAVFTCTGTNQCSTAPIDMVSGLPVYLSLYGTGFRQGVHTPLRINEVQCQVGGKNATVQFAGPQSVYPGLDQLNLLIPQSLPSGQAAVQCGFGTIQSNTVSIAIK